MNKQERIDAVQALVIKHKISKAAAEELMGLVAKPAKSKQLKPCGCGCPLTTASRFAPGHDSVLKSRLQEAFRAGRPISEPVPVAPEAGTDPMAIAKVLGWEQFMTAKKPKAKKVKKTAEGEDGGKGKGPRVASVKSTKQAPPQLSAKEKAQRAVEDDDERRLERAQRVARTQREAAQRKAS